MKIKKLKNTPERKAFWANIEKIAKEVRSWKNYKERIKFLEGNYSSGY